jgi:hypothetical protein
LFDQFLGELNQSHWLQLQGSCEPEEYTHSRLPLAALHEADKCPVYLCSVGQFLLRDTDFLPHYPQNFTERQSWIQRILPIA